MCVYIYIYMYIYIYIYKYIYMYICKYVFISTYVYIHIFVCIYRIHHLAREGSISVQMPPQSKRQFSLLRARARAHLCVFVYVRVFMYVCVRFSTCECKVFGGYLQIQNKLVSCSTIGDSREKGGDMGVGGVPMYQWVYL